MAETYTKDEVLAIFAAIGSRLVDDSQGWHLMAEVKAGEGSPTTEVEGYHAIATALEKTQIAIYEVVNKLTDGTDPQTI